MNHQSITELIGAIGNLLGYDVTYEENQMDVVFPLHSLSLPSIYKHDSPLNTSVGTYHTMVHIQYVLKHTVEQKMLI